MTNNGARGLPLVRSGHHINDIIYEARLDNDWQLFLHNDSSQVRMRYEIYIENHSKGLETRDPTL